MVWRRFSVLLLFISLGFFGLTYVNASGGDTTPVNMGQWFAVYYPNEDLAGNPVAIQTQPNIGGNWGFGVPVPSLPDDHWSARWSQTFDLAPGQYRISVRADDGVRVYLNNALIIDEWHGFFPDTYTAEFNATNQAQTIYVEYFDSVDQAYLNFTLLRVNGTQVIPVGTTATILYNNTNGYLEPNATATVRYLLPAGVDYEIISVTPDNQYVQLRVTGIGVWVRAQDVRINGTIAPQPTPIPPVVATPLPPVANSNFPQATVNTSVLNVREVPDAGSRLVTQLHQGETYTVRRGSINGWLQLIINGDLGWVDADFVTLNTQQNLVYLAGTATATVQAARLNVRNRPEIPSDVVTKVNRLDTYPIVGQDDSGRWIMLDVNGTFGWVNRDYMTVNATFTLPVIGDVPPVIPPAREYIVAMASPYNVNMRSGPGTTFADLGLFDRGNDAHIIGRTADNNWWQIEYDGIIAWVSARYALVQENADLNAIPVTG